MNANRMMKRGAASAALALSFMAMSPSPGAAQTFDSFHVFGDSLSDAGTYDVPLLGPSKFTVNSYPVWNQLLGEKYGLTVSPYLSISVLTGASTVVGGSNFAQGGACVDFAYGPDCTLFSRNNLSETQQIATYLALTGGRADPNGLYSVWAGANDAFTQAELVGNGTIAPAQAIANLATAATQHVANIATLSHAGARYIVVPNLPDITSTPMGVAGSPAERAFYELAGNTYNAVLNAGLQSLGGSNIVYANVYGMLNEVIADPARYGLSNVTTPGCWSILPSSLLCWPSTLNDPDAATTYLFADSVHPSPAGHALLADYVGAILAAPGQAALLAESPIHAGRGVLRTLDARITGIREDKRGYHLYGHADFASYTLDSAVGHPGINGRVAGGYLGIEYGFGDGVKAGALLNYSGGSAKLSHDRGRYDTDMISGSLYGEMRAGGAYAQWSGTFGAISYDGIERRFALGPATRINSGSTTGRYLGTRLATGYDFVFDRVSLGPIAQLTYQHASVSGYSETQNDATAMTFGNQNRHLFYGTIGARASFDADLGGLRLKPSAQLSYNYDFTDQVRSVTASLVGAPVSFAMPVYQRGRSWADATLGATLEFNNAFSGSISIGSQFGQDQVSSYYGNVGLSYRF